VRRFLLVCALCIIPSSLYASCPTCSNPNLPGSDGDRLAVDLENNGLRLGMSLRASTARSTHRSSAALSSAGAGDSNGQSTRTWDYQMFACNIDLEHAASTHVGWAMTIPVRYMKVTESAGPAVEDAHPATHFGLGDVSLYGTVYLRGQSPHSWWISSRLGFTIPSGNILADPNEASEEDASHEHIFFGSGTFDPRLLLSAGYRISDWTLQANAHYQTSLYANRHEYRAGTQLGGGLSVHSRFGLERWSFGLRGDGFYGTAAEWTGSGSKDLFSGKSGVLLGVETSYESSGWELSLGLDRPFITATVDGEFEVPAILRFGTAYTF
jgi:hypothetical protein